MPDRYIVTHRVKPHPSKPTPAEIVDTDGTHAMVVGYFPDRHVARRVTKLLNDDEAAKAPKTTVYLDGRPASA